ncbi:hypothetical protein Bca52824_037968 [Brassica carinata]|uniref:Uncharacterized protein n=1 Tax=Brassica carinata TaxID=52824 RepID=A0A8X7UUI2_BRACI|nr:hypothetical protein Bca52824_037968 [Brassica carinata]
MDWLLVDKDKLPEAKEFAELETTYCSTVLGTSMDECNLSRFLSNRRRVSPSSPQPYDAINATAATFNGKKTQETRIAVDAGHYKSTTGTGSVLAYKDKKIFDANSLIENVTQSACCYVVVRREGKGVLSMGEISEEVGIDLHQLGSMVKRVVEYLGFELEEYDLVGLFVKTVNDSSRLRGVDVKKKERVMTQGVFLMNCSLKGFLSTGRRPMPLVVAVLAFVCGVNGGEVKELSEKLVKVAREVGLPWARDVTVKNVVRHSGVLFGLMEEKSMRKRRDESVRSDGVCLKEIVRDCLNKKVKYSYDDDGGVRRSGFEMVSSEDWWKGRSKMSQRLTLKEVLEKDVGLDDLPPSYIKVEVSCVWRLNI